MSALTQSTLLDTGPDHPPLLQDLHEQVRALWRPGSVQP